MPSCVITCVPLVVCLYTIYIYIYAYEDEEREKEWNKNKKTKQEFIRAEDVTLAGKVI